MWTSPSNTILLHSRRSLATACLFFIPIVFKSSSTSSLHLLRDLPLFLIPSTVAVAICFDIRSYCFLATCPYHLSREGGGDFINFTVSVLRNMSLFSLFILIFLCSPSFTGACIFLAAFHSNILSSLIYSVVVVQASDPHVCEGRIRLSCRYF